MAGAGVTITVNNRRVLDALGDLLQTIGNPAPALRDVGEYLHLAHDARFVAQQSPDGAAWAPLSPRYRARKKKNRDKILLLDGYLSGTLAYQLDADGQGLMFGTGRIYGATHQFGDSDRGIPKREYLGVSADDEVEILDIFSGHLRRAV